MTVTAHKLTPEDLEALVEAGRLHPRAELIDGNIYDHMTPSHRHVAAVERLEEALVERYGLRFLRVEKPLDSGDGSFPEPDLVLLAVDRSSLSAHPTVSQTVAVIEVAGTSLIHDTTTKARHYESAGVGIYIVIDLVSRSTYFGYPPTGATPAADELLAVCTAAL